MVEDAKLAPRDRSPWVVIVSAAVLISVLAGIGFGAWHDHIRGPKYMSAAEVTRYNQTWSACIDENANHLSGIPACMNKNGFGPPSYPWPTTHAWLSAALVFLAALVIGRLIVFMYRVENRR